LQVTGLQAFLLSCFVRSSFVVPTCEGARMRIELPLTDDWARMQLHLVCDRRATDIPAIAELLAHLAAG